MSPPDSLSQAHSIDQLSATSENERTAIDAFSSPDFMAARPKKGPQATSATTPGHSAPTTFFLRTEKEIEECTQRRYRKLSHGSSAHSEEPLKKSYSANLMGDSSFGVQSLEETISSTFSSDSNLSRMESQSSDNASENALYDDGSDHTPLSRKRRSAKNRVHPTIMATGRRIISSERVPTHTPAGKSPTGRSTASFTDSPIRQPLRRRGSGASSINISQPITPVKFSPHLDVATPSTPRSASPKSFLLSDEESVADDRSQAIASSCDDEDDQDVERTPQLVMPSLAMPVRRPFTEQGRRIGRAKIMIIGPKGVGKTHFINSMCRSTEHIVHVDQTPLAASHSSFSIHTPVEHGSTAFFTEIHASTRPYPPWWTDVESRRPRRNSIGTGVLERNLIFIDTPGIDTDDDVHHVLNHVKSIQRRTTSMETLSDMELVSMLSGDGGVQVDAVVYLFDATFSGSYSLSLSIAHQELFRYLCEWTNLIPVMGKADAVTPETLILRKRQILEMLSAIKAEPYMLSEVSGGFDGLTEPLAVSSALGNDDEVIDASVLMASQYMRPLIPSELGVLVDSMLSPSNISRMRHLSAAKYVLWRKKNGAHLLDLHKPQLPESPYLRSHSPDATSNVSLLEGGPDPSKELVPHSSSSYYCRSTSPAVSAVSSVALTGAAAPVMGASNFALARHNEQHTQPSSEPFRQVRLAKWAEDLQRSLAHERQKYRHMYHQTPSEWSNNTEEGGEKHDKQQRRQQQQQALVPAARDGLRPARGRLGGALGVIDPRDPLGVLAFGHAFRRRGFFALQLVGGCGLLGAVAYWVVRNWVEVQVFFGFLAPSTILSGAGGGRMVHAAAVPPPAKHSSWLLDENTIRGFFGWTDR